MIDGTPPKTRVGYIRTTSEPDKTHDDAYAFVRDYVRQQRPEFTGVRPHHRFLLGASNIFDGHILNVIINSIPTSINSNFANLSLSDFELRISEARASTRAGVKTIKRCEINDVGVVICGKDDRECDEIMLEQSDYLIASHICGHWSLDQSWYWDYARPGIAQDNMLTNSKYDLRKHDVSLTRLRDRYAGYAWRSSSGGCHGNFPWQCWCGGTCKRGRCSIFRVQERPVNDYDKLPTKGHASWRNLTADDVCQKYRMQSRYGRRNVEGMLTMSIDTFSGE